MLVVRGWAGPLRPPKHGAQSISRELFAPSSVRWRLTQRLTQPLCRPEVKGFFWLIALDLKKPARQV